MPPKKRHAMVSFRADEETLHAIDLLVAALPGSIIDRRRKSIAIRTAILSAAKPLRGLKVVK
jgi:hypothetical protein